MRNKYEIDLIIALDQDGSTPKETFQWVQNFITEDGGTILHTSAMGNKRLAYEIQKRKDGYYGIIYFEAEPTIWEELERQLKLNKAVLRYMSLKLTKAAIAELLDEKIIKNAELAAEEESEQTFDESEDTEVKAETEEEASEAEEEVKEENEEENKA